MRSIIIEGPKETRKFAADFAERLIKKKSGKALIVALTGELGSGKTTFIKGFSKALGIREKILSPTFVLIHKHKLQASRFPPKADPPGADNFQFLYHIDAYRLKSKKDLAKLGIKEIFADPRSIVLIEWADRVKKAIPKSTAWIHFNHLEKNKRRIIIK